MKIVIPKIITLVSQNAVVLLVIVPLIIGASEISSKNFPDRGIIYDSIPILYPKEIMITALETMAYQEGKYHKDTIPWFIDIVHDSIHKDWYGIRIGGETEIVSWLRPPVLKKHKFPVEDKYISWEQNYLAGITKVLGLRFVIIFSEKDKQLFNLFFEADSTKKEYVGIRWKIHPDIEHPCEWYIRWNRKYGDFQIMSPTFYYYHLKKEDEE